MIDNQNNIFSKGRTGKSFKKNKYETKISENK
jgi:hypothetical protein